MPAAIITTDELQEFKVELLEEIRTILSENEPQTSKWLRSAEVRKLLKISPGTLQNLRVNGTLPYTKVGGVIYYAHEDIMKMFEDHKGN